MLEIDNHLNESKGSTGQNSNAEITATEPEVTREWSKKERNVILNYCYMDLVSKERRKQTA